MVDTDDHGYNYERIREQRERNEVMRIKKIKMNYNKKNGKIL